MGSFFDIEFGGYAQFLLDSLSRFFAVVATRTKHLRPMVSTIFVLHLCKSRVLYVVSQDVGLVARAVHPCCHNFLNTCLTPCNVLGYCYEAVSRFFGTVCQ